MAPHFSIKIASVRGSMFSTRSLKNTTSWHFALREELYFRKQLKICTKNMEKVMQISQQMHTYILSNNFIPWRKVSQCRIRLLGYHSQLAPTISELYLLKINTNLTINLPLLSTPLPRILMPMTDQGEGLHPSELRLNHFFLFIHVSCSTHSQTFNTQSLTESTQEIIHLTKLRLHSRHSTSYASIQKLHLSDNLHLSFLYNQTSERSKSTLHAISSFTPILLDTTSLLN